MNDVFGPGSNVEKRLVSNYEELTRRIEACRSLGFKIVATSGTYDLLHEGHCAYLEKAKLSVDSDPNNVILVVGLDSDEKVMLRKKRKPIGDQDGRLRTLCHIRHVDLVIVKNVGDERRAFIKAIKPDVLVISQTTRHSNNYKDEVAQWCAKIVELEPQATTSTTARIRKAIVGFRDPLEAKVDQIHKELKGVIAEIFGDQIVGGGQK